MDTKESSRISPLKCLLAEISLQIFSYLDLKPQELTGLLTVDRQFYEFLKAHEAALVQAAYHPQNALDFLLVLGSNPTYAAFSKLGSDKDVYDLFYKYKGTTEAAFS
jgi:hypothetical protein